MNRLNLTVVIFIPVAAFGQAVTEYGLGAGRGAITTAPTRSLGKGIGGIVDSLNKTIDSNHQAVAAEPATPQPSTRKPQAAGPKQSTKPADPKPDTAETAAPTPPPAPVYEDPKQIQAGIAYDEMLRRFGPPSMSVTSETGSRTLWYSAGDTTYQFEMEDGKVVAPRHVASE